MFVTFEQNKTKSENRFHLPNAKGVLSVFVFVHSSFLGCDGQSWPLRSFWCIHAIVVGYSKTNIYQNVQCVCVYVKLIRDWQCKLIQIKSTIEARKWRPFELQTSYRCLHYLKCSIQTSHASHLDLCIVGIQLLPLLLMLMINVVQCNISFYGHATKNLFPNCDV